MKIFLWIIQSHGYLSQELEMPYVPQIGSSISIGDTEFRVRNVVYTVDSGMISVEVGDENLTDEELEIRGFE